MAINKITFKKITNKVTRNEMKGWIYNTKEESPEMSYYYAELLDRHGKVKDTLSDRLYYIVSGEGIFMADNSEIKVEQGDVLKVEKDTAYDFWPIKNSSLKFFMVTIPAFNREFEVKFS